MNHRLVSLVVPSLAFLPAVALLACGSSSSSEGGGDAGGDVAADVAHDVTTAGEGGGPDGGSDSSPLDGGADSSLPTDGGGQDAITDGAADAPADGPFQVAPHPPLPRMTHYGKPDAGVLPAPKVVTITFPGEPFETQLAELGAGLTSSPFWDAFRPGFCEPAGPCVGDGPPGEHYSLPLPVVDGGTMSGRAFETWLAAQIGSGALPAPDGASPTNTIYTVVFQKGFPFAGACTSFLGYHSAMTYGPSKQLVTYAIVTECAAGAGMTSLELTTQTVNHEIAEAATDPGGPGGYYLDLNDPNTIPWNNLLGGEVGDLCDWYGPSPNFTYWPGENVDYGTPDAGTLSIQRIWSPFAAAKGQDPCLPVPPGVVFFGVAPAQELVVLDVGGSATIDGYAFSLAPVAPFNLEVGASSKYLKVQVSGVPTADGGVDAVVNNGDVVKLTFTLLADPGSINSGNGGVVIHTWSGSRATPSAAYDWPLIVMSPSDAKDAGLDSGVTMRPEGHPVTPRPLPWTRPEALLLRR